MPIKCGSGIGELTIMMYIESGHSKKSSMVNLKGKVVLITGGSRGIGAATATMFARAGADVIITYHRNVTAARKVLKIIEINGGEGVAIRADVGKSADCHNVITKAFRRFKRIDVLVNNASIWEYGRIDSMTDRQWQKTIQINLNGVFNMCRVVVPIMKKQKYGRIINISSTAGQRGEAFYSHYAASKGGIIALTKSMASELTEYGIHTNCVAPGWVDTDMTAHVLKNKKEKQKILSTIPRNVIPTPEEIAGPIVFLASPLANNIVGEILNVNGGSILCG